MRPSFFQSVHGRLLAVLLGLTALPALLIGALAYDNARRTVEARVEAQLTSIADLKKEQIAAWLDARSADARLLGDNFLNQEHFTEILDPTTDPERRDAFAAFLTDNLVGVQRARDGYSEILFVDAAGRVILSTDPASVGTDLAGDRAVALTLRSDTGEYLQDIHHAPASGQIEMAFGHVLHKVDLATEQVLPEVNGAVIIRVRMDQTIYPLILGWPGMGATGETLLVRANGDSALFLNPLRFNEAAALNFGVPLGSPDARPAQLAAAGHEGIIQTTDYRGVLVLAAYRAIPQTGWGFVAKEDLAEAYAPVDDLTRQWLLVTAVVLGAAFGVTTLLARALTQPLAQLAASAQAVAGGDFSQAVPFRRGDEIGQLATAFQSMVAAVSKREGELKSNLAELALLNQLGRDIASNLDLRAVASEVVAHVAEHFDAEIASLWLYDDGNDELVAYTAAGRGVHRFAPGIRAPLTEGIAGEAGQFRRTCLVNGSTFTGAGEALEGWLPGSQVAVPILREGTLHGVLVVSSGPGRGFSPADVRLLETLASQLAPAIENAQLFRDLSASYDHTLDALAAALDARDKETEGHSRRVVAYTLALARQLGVPEAELPAIRRGALLHDIGKIGVPDAILLKPGPLDEAEWVTMRRHPEWGERILSSVPFMRDPAEIVCAHQERWDGRGYPQGLAGEAIPLGARIFAVADTLDAITSDRPYRAARPYAAARDEIEAGAGTQFDPQVVEAFLAIAPAEWAALRAEAAAAPIAPALPPLWAEPPPASPALQALARLIEAVNGSLDLPDMLREATRTTVETLGAAAAGLFLYDAATDSLTLAADYGLPRALKERFAHFPVAGFHNESVVREACARLHHNVAEVPAFVELGLPADQPEWSAYLCVPLTARGEVLGVLGCFSRHPRAFEAHEVALYEAIGEQIGLAVSNARLYQSVQQLAITDALTGAHNRRYLNEFLSSELLRCARYGCGVALLMLDIDNFKEYNDAHGHLAGDEALRQLVGLLRNHLRVVDVIARYGGDEMAVVLPETEARGAQVVAEKIRAGIEAYSFPHGRLSASVGVAFWDGAPAPTPEAFIAMADQALYRAKRNGRDRICLWEAELAQLPRQTGMRAD